MPHAVDLLTRTEARVLALAEQGLSNQQIAETMAISIGTVKSHLHQCFEKLDARSRLHAINKARTLGLSPRSAETLGACKT